MVLVKKKIIGIIKNLPINLENHSLLVVNLISFIIVANYPRFIVIWLFIPSIYYIYKRDIPKFCATWVLAQVIWNITLHIAFLSLGVNTIFIGDAESNDLLYRYLDSYNPYFKEVAGEVIYHATKRCEEEGTLFEMTIYTWADVISFFSLFLGLIGFSILIVIIVTLIEILIEFVKKKFTK